MQAKSPALVIIETALSAQRAVRLVSVRLCTGELEVLATSLLPGPVCARLLFGGLWCGRRPALKGRHDCARIHLVSPLSGFDLVGQRSAQGFASLHPGLSTCAPLALQKSSRICASRGDGSAVCRLIVRLLRRAGRASRGVSIDPGARRRGSPSRARLSACSSRRW